MRTALMACGILGALCACGGDSESDDGSGSGTETDAASTADPSGTTTVDPSDSESGSGVVPETCIEFGSGRTDITGAYRYDSIFESVVGMQALLEDRVLAVEAALDLAAQAWDLPALPKPVTASDVEALVAEIAAQVPPEVLDRLASDFARPACVLDLDVAHEAASACMIEAGCTPPATASPVVCNGICDGDCDGACDWPMADPSFADCPGRCEGTCIVDTPAACQGICEGICSIAGVPEDGEYAGSCPRTCEGLCFMSDGGACPGVCEGVCVGDPAGASCRGTCDGACEGRCVGAVDYDCDAWDCGPLASAAAAVAFRCDPVDLRFAYPTRGDDPDLDAKLDAFAVPAAELLSLRAELRDLLTIESYAEPTNAPVFVLRNHIENLISAGVVEGIVAPAREHCTIPAVLDAFDVLRESVDAALPMVEVTEAFEQSFHASFTG